MFHKTKFISLIFIIMMLTLVACSTNTASEPEGNSVQKEQEMSEKDAPDVEVVTIPELDLQKKDKGKEVEQLQKALNHVGYDLDVNGIYDENTTWAITDFQLQQDLMALGVFNEETRKALDKFIKDEKTIEAFLGLPIQAEPVSTNSGTPIIANPYDQLALVNKESALPKEYIPDDLVIPDVPFPYVSEDDPKRQMRKVAADALEKMFKAAEKEGLEFYAQSGFRSYEIQEFLFNNYKENHGEEEANKFSARPGESEHQSGLTMDITSPEIGPQLVTEFGETDEGKWLQEHAHEYGFIIRYPKGKEEITLYQYEPWHIRYVGEKAAKEMMENNLTLEEYYE